MGHVDHARVHAWRVLLEGRQVRRVPAEQPAAGADRQQPSPDLRRGQERPGAGVPGGHLQPLRRSGNGFNGCSSNNWPTDQGTQTRSSCRRQGRLRLHERSAVHHARSSRTTPPSRRRTRRSRSSTSPASTQRAGTRATAAGKPKGCYDFAPIAGTCGAPNNDRHPFLGCLAGQGHQQPTTATCGATSSSSSISPRVARRATTCATCRAPAWRPCVAVLVE